MNILFTSNLSGLGGGETSILLLMEKFSKNNQVILLCPQDGKFPSVAREKGITVLIENFKRRNLLYTIFKLRKILIKYEIDIVHNNECSTAILFSIIKTIYKLKYHNFWTCHGQWYQISKLKAVFLRKKINKIFCVSKNVYNNLQKQGIDNIVLSYLGVCFPQNIPQRSNTLRKELGLRADDILIATIARYEVIKGQIKAIRGLNEILNEDPSIHYVLIGGEVFGNKEDKIYYNQTISEIEKFNNGNLHVLGERDDLPQIYSDIDLLLVPSDRESLSMVTLEAISCGIPVISTPCQGPQEILDNNVNMICEENNAESIEHKVKEFLYNSDIHKKVIQDTLYLRVALIENFDINNVVQIYEHWFNKRY